MNNVKKSIGWCDFTVNPIKGLCKGGCSYCYAKNMYKRFKLDPTIRFKPDVIDEAAKLKKPSRIFVCSTHDIMGDWIPDEWIEAIIDKVKKCPQHKFMFLSKYPERYEKFIFEPNCWVGETCSQGTTKGIFLAPSWFHYVSCEPLQYYVIVHWYYNWIIIGAQTQPLRLPNIKWIKHLVEQARDYEIPIYMKSNLKKVWPDELIREFPE